MLIEVNKSKTSGCNLWISGLSATTRATDLKSLFSKYGKVINAKVVTNTRTPTSGTARCYGYVTMSSVKDATECIEHLHRTELHGRLISVERAKTDFGSSTGKDKDKSDKGKESRVDGKKDTRTSRERERERRHRSQERRERERRERRRNDRDRRRSRDRTRDKDDRRKSDADRKKKDDSKKSDKENVKSDAEKKEGDPEKAETAATEENGEAVPVEGAEQKEGAEGEAKSESEVEKKEGDTDAEAKPRKDSKGRSVSKSSKRSTSRSRARRSRSKEILTFEQIREQRERERLRKKERELREEERRRRDIARRQREEEHRLVREREKLALERARIEKEKAELLRLERERQKLEREKIELERLELKRQQRKYGQLIKSNHFTFTSSSSSVLSKRSRYLTTALDRSRYSSDFDAISAATPASQQFLPYFQLQVTRRRRQDAQLDDRPLRRSYSEVTSSSIGDSKIR